ncbi:hypothetical protein FNV43_RR09713 [Rhamnella rubrinervis]|uniref:Pentatricopeptide repeat-containing protein n=1 Tax=Rhamnella rubrinervis TaxID=2594499 RepID=A0A8K0HB82_9ROSA|nr:hypothetical protein FNV43_RR09713 [Rhamnella rubrinervis]
MIVATQGQFTSIFAATFPVSSTKLLVVLFNACGQSGAVDRAFDVLSGVYTIAANCCSETDDWEFACNVYDDMSRKGMIPDEMFLSALIDVAGHAGNLDDAFEILQEARNQGIHIGIMSYSSLMGACCSVCITEAVKQKSDGDQLQKAMEVLSEMKALGLCPNILTYSMLVVANENFVKPEEEAECFKGFNNPSSDALTSQGAYDDQNSVKNTSQGSKRLSPSTRLSQTEDHIVAEKKQREKLSQSFVVYLQ